MSETKIMPTPGDGDHAARFDGRAPKRPDDDIPTMWMEAQPTLAVSYGDDAAPRTNAGTGATDEPTDDTIGIGTVAETESGTERNAPPEPGPEVRVASNLDDVGSDEHTVAMPAPQRRSPGPRRANSEPLFVEPMPPRFEPRFGEATVDPPMPKTRVFAPRQAASSQASETSQPAQTKPAPQSKSERTDRQQPERHEPTSHDEQPRDERRRTGQPDAPGNETMSAYPGATVPLPHARRSEQDAHAPQAHHAASGARSARSDQAEPPERQTGRVSPPDGSAAMDRDTSTILDGRYQLTHLLGKGGMGRVFLARDLRLFGRPVAVKELLPALSGDQSFRERFIREEQVLANVSSPHHVPALYDVGPDGAPIPYYVMEYVRGCTLRTLIQLTPKQPVFSLDDVTRIMLELFEGLSEIHRLGFIHRDVKPDNISLDTAGCVKLMDFGIARPVSDGHLTMVGQQVGSRLYSSPEQRQGVHVDEKTDVYSAGVVMFELLTAQYPQATTSGGLHPLQLRRVPSDIVETLPEWVDDLCFSMLQQDPRRRPSSLKVLEQLRAVVNRPQRTGAHASVTDVAPPVMPPATTPTPDATTAEAMRFLGNLYLHGGHCLERDPRAAAKWYETAAVRGDVKALYNMGILNHAGRHMHEARACFRAVEQSAQADDALKAQAHQRLLACSGSE